MDKVWNHPVTITENNFVYKSLSNWACNLAVGCNHACRFCYVPSASTNKLAPILKPLGVDDPDAQWGEYVFPRTWNAASFESSLNKAENTPLAKLKPDGNRAVMFCSTTDPYQVLPSDTASVLTFSRQRALRLILERSTLNVRILTRGPLARVDFPLMKEFGNRLLFGMSLPTLRNDLARVYEPHAPSPSSRLECLKRAKDAGLNVYVAIAPTYPECDLDDIEATLSAVKELNPVTIFHEPINIRSENVERIRAQGEAVGVKVKTEVFSSREAWENYATNQFFNVEHLATKHGLHQLHLWPDKSLKSWAKKGVVSQRTEWLEKWHNRISEWPGRKTA